MRVIAGIAKGHPLKFPKGAPTRPATDLVKGAIFSILENVTGDWDQVLDIFSGSGGLGIEALSRGAGWVDFIDRDPRCCAIIKENLENTKLAGQAHIYCTNVEKALTFLDKEYNIILMDPPYADTSVGSIIEQVANSRLAGENTKVVVTHSSRFHLETHYASLIQTKEHRHGDSCIAIYEKDIRS
jgi:16S rRNA (guanine966-N2)-methyltransferase